jgi:hypothetical protein
MNLRGCMDRLRGGHHATLAFAVSTQRAAHEKRKRERAAAALPRAASGKTPMAAIAGGHRAKLELNSRSS